MSWRRLALDRLAAASIVGSTIGVVERVARWPQGRLSVLTYHRVDEVARDGRDPALISATPEQFDRQVAHLREQCSLVSLGDVVRAHAGGADLPDRAVLLTFDDGVDDFRTHALPVLRRHEAPAVVFVPTGFVGDASASFWWDAVYAAIVMTERTALKTSPLGPLELGSPDERVQVVRRVRGHLKQLPWREVSGHVRQICEDLAVEAPPANVMSWESIRRLPDEGIDVCAHTRTHPHLDRVPLDVAREEIVGSVDDLRQHLGAAAPGFAYPSGQWSPAVAQLVAECGIPLAFTTQRGSHRVGVDDQLTVRRINVSRRTGLNAARAFMHPWTDRLTTRADRTAERASSTGRETT